MEHSANKRSNANGECSSFLWNQLVSGAPVVLGIDAYRPPAVKIKDQVLNAAFRTALEKRAEQSVLSSLAGTVQFSAESDGIIIVLDQVPGCTPSPLRSNVIQVPCKFDKVTQGSGTTNSSKEDWLAKLTTFEDAWHYASLECGLGFSLAVAVDMVARIKGPSCDLTMSAVTPMLPLRLVPLFPIPVLRSGVQDTLSSPHAAALPDFGFVTLCGDHLCFHFKHQLEDGGLNFIGVWISGVASVEHPFIWLVCAQFVTSQRLASRPKDIFVVCILSSKAVTAANVSFGKAPEEVLFFNCLCQSQASLHFQLWQGAAVTSVARVPSASNKTISMNLEKVLSGAAAETFHMALKELVKNRVPLVGSSEQNSSALTRDSWVPTPKPARSQNFNMAPTVPDVSDCSMGLSVHSRSGNASVRNTRSDLRSENRRLEHRFTRRLLCPAFRCFTGRPNDYARTSSYWSSGFRFNAFCVLRKNRKQSGPPVLSLQPLAGENGKKNEKLTCNAGTMTEASTQLVHRSVQTDKIAIEGSSSAKGCSFCAHCKQEQRASEIPERDTDYTIFFPEKSPHLGQRLTHKPSPTMAATIPHRQPADCLPRPAFVHSKTSDLLMTPAVSFRDDPSLLPDRLERSKSRRGRKMSMKREHGIAGELLREQCPRPPRRRSFIRGCSTKSPGLSAQRHDELSFQVDRIAHKYCPEGVARRHPHWPRAQCRCRRMHRPICKTTDLTLTGHGTAL
ncbi:hypothetical protein MTO96_027419 [Rhipicephalus appendiculatus]